jgi:Glycine zipper 2TM domain
MANAWAKVVNARIAPTFSKVAESRNGKTMRIRLLQESSALRGIAGIAALSALALSLAACQTAPPPQPPPPAAAYAGPPVNTTVYAYPQNGQSSDQQNRDRYECSEWAVHQTGFDPSAPTVPAQYRVVASGPPPGTGTAVGAIAGAVIGAAISPRWDRGAGAVFGGLTGAMIGSASDAQRAQNNQIQMSEAQQQQYAAMAQKASDYRRALSACLEGRGYSVK